MSADSNPFSEWSRGVLLGLGSQLPYNWKSLRMVPPVFQNESHTSSPNDTTESCRYYLLRKAQRPDNNALEPSNTRSQAPRKRRGGCLAASLFRG